MIRNVHRAASLLAALTVATFFLSTLWVELTGPLAAVAQVKGLIVFPGLFVLVPAIALTGATGFALGRQHEGRLVDAKRRRMPLIVANGLLVLIPSAVLLNQWAAAGRFDTGFYLLQAVELLAGATNLVLMGLNARDGLRMRAKPRQQHAGS